MNFEDRNDIAIAAHFCTKCMSPKYIAKNRACLAKHSTHDCYMSMLDLRHQCYYEENALEYAHLLAGQGHLDGGLLPDKTLGLPLERNNGKY